jgi:hypothetical protein
MQTMGRGALSQASRQLLPDVAEVCDIAYAMHVADDPSVKGTLTQETARRIVSEFNALRVSSGTVEAAYLQAARGIALSLARGITRRKQQWLAELADAEHEKDALLQRIRDARRAGNGLNAAWKLLAPAALMLAGYITGKILALIVPGEVAAQTGERLPSILLGLVFVLAWRTFSFWLSDRQRGVIEAEYHARRTRADLTYEDGKLKEYRVYRERLREAWHEYTGETYPVTASYQMVMEADLEMRRRMRQELRARDRTLLWTVKRILRMTRLRPLLRK